MNLSMQLQIRRILYLGLIIGILIISSNISRIAGQQYPVDVQILSSTSGWCSGTAVIGNDTLYYDHNTIAYLTLGIANLDTIFHSLSQLTLTINGVNDRGSMSFLKVENLTSNAGLPLILPPQNYWTYNVSCTSCQTLANISLEVDGEWFEFEIGQLITLIGSSFWPPSWGEVVYYTETSNNIPASSLGIISGIGVVSVILVFKRRKKERRIQ